MDWNPCYGRECKLGWGWNESLDILIPVEENPRNVTSEVVNQRQYSVDYFLSNHLVCWASFSFISEIYDKNFRTIYVFF